MEFLRRLWSEWDIKIVAGTDAIQTLGDCCLGLELQSQAGMSNMEVIRSTASVAAKAIRMDNQIGTVEAGKAVDLIVVEQDSLEDISALRAMTMVMPVGRVTVPFVRWRSEPSQEVDVGVHLRMSPDVSVSGATIGEAIDGTVFSRRNQAIEPSIWSSSIRLFHRGDGSPSLNPEVGIPGDFPQVAVRVCEVPGVPTPEGILGRLDQGRAGPHRRLKQFVNLSL